MGASHHAGHCALEGWKALHTPAGHRRRRHRRHLGLKALAAMVLCLATKYGTGTDGRRAAAAEEQNRGR